MSIKVEVIYFAKPCPHCKEMLFRVEKTSMAWSECRNNNCSYLVSQLEPYIECFNRR